MTVDFTIAGGGGEPEHLWDSHVNHTVFSGDVETVHRALRQSDRTAFVTPPHRDRIVVFERASDEPNREEIDAVARLLSAACEAPVLAKLNYEQESLLLSLWGDGEELATFATSPEVFGQVHPACTALQFGEALSEVLGWKVSEGIAAILTKSREEYSEEYVRYQVLANWLSLPPASVGCGFMQIEDYETGPHGFEKSELTRIG